MSLVAELRRRGVFRVAAAYLVVGWLLTEVLTTILPELGAPDWASRAVILIFAFGFVPTVIFAWVYEITPEGIRRDHGTETDDADTRKLRKRFDHIAIASAVLLIVVVGLFSAQRTSDETAPATLINQSAPVEVSDASVAVLPFVNLSSDKDNEYFSDGLTETLLHMLAQIPDLKVAARTSSFAFKGKAVGIQEIARALEVAHVLEGSVQRIGDRVRITAQLIRASDGFHVWSSNFDRQVDDIFGIQDEIAEKVGYALSESLLGTGAHISGLQTTDADAYDLYMQARKQRATYSYGGLQAAEDLLKGALLIDPDFIEAKTELATSYFLQLETGLMDAHDAYPEIIAIADQVLADRPDDPVALAASVYANSNLRILNGDVSAAAELVGALEKIVADSPASLEPRILLVRAYHNTMERDKAVAVLKEALRRDPFNPTIFYELGNAYMRVEQWDDARAALERSLDIEPKQPNAHINLGSISLQAGDAIGFVSQILKAMTIDPKDHELPGMLAAFLYRLELVEIADDFQERVLTLAPTSEVAYQIELLRAINTGDEEASVASARRAIEDDVEERRGAYTNAIRYLLRHAIEHDNVQQELQWIDQQAPGVFDIDAERVPPKYRMAQGAAFDAWYASLPRNEVLRRLDTIINFGNKTGFDIKEGAYTYVNILSLRGETDEAIKVALGRIFSQPVAKNLGWREFFAGAQHAGVVADPRIQAAMDRWEDDETRLRNQVGAYFNDLQTDTRTASSVESAKDAADGLGQRTVSR